MARANTKEIETENNLLYGGRKGAGKMPEVLPKFLYLADDGQEPHLPGPSIQEHNKPQDVARGKRRKVTRVFRVSEREYDLLRSYVALHGLTISTFVRKALLGEHLSYGNNLTARLILSPLQALVRHFTALDNFDIVESLK